MNNYGVVKKSRKALVATMLAAVLIIGTVVSAMATVVPTPPNNANLTQNTALITDATASFAQGASGTLAAAAKAEGTHYEWYSSDRNQVNINRRTGNISIPSNASIVGTTTITVYLVNGAQAEQGEGTSSTGQWYPQESDIISYDTCEVSVTSSSGYGWQGTGGLRLLMTAPTQISVSGSIIGETGIINTITNPVTVTDGVAQFEFQLDAGLNKTTSFTERGNINRVHVYTYTGGILGTTPVGTITDLGTDLETSPSPTVTISASGLTTGSYVLAFDSTVQGGNQSKTLGTNVYFIFNVQ